MATCHRRLLRRERRAARPSPCYPPAAQGLEPVACPFQPVLRLRRPLARFSTRRAAINWASVLAHGAARAPVSGGVPELQSGLHSKLSASSRHGHLTVSPRRQRRGYRGDDRIRSPGGQEDAHRRQPAGKLFWTWPPNGPRFSAPTCPT
jgi:hypothetical protein